MTKPREPWCVRLAGTADAIEAYKALAAASGSIELFDDPEGSTWITGPALIEHANTPGGGAVFALSAAAVALQLLHGTHGLLFGSRQDVQLAGEARNGRDGKTVVTVEATLQWRIHARLSERLPGLVDAATLLRAAEHDVDFRWAVECWSRDDLDYIDYRRISERLNVDGRPELENAFKTMHNRSLSGDRSLHGRQKGLGPQGVPLTDQEIRAVLTPVLHQRAREIVEATDTIS